ncbi:hypothetical protein [Hyphomicrobium sp.]|nr:hypothetical protein [Hyphomicrobium sp.]
MARAILTRATSIVCLVAPPIFTVPDIALGAIFGVAGAVPGVPT